MVRFLPLVLIALVIAAFISYLPMNSDHNQTLSDIPQGDYRLEEVVQSHGDFDFDAYDAYFDNQQTAYPGGVLAEAFNQETNAETVVLGTTNAAGVEKWIEVDLAKQQVTAWEGNTQVRQFLISSGRWAPTPTGTFNIWYKTRSQLMKGGSKQRGDYYYLPNVPHNMYFFQGYALHGAYWHNNFGHTMSHGCVNEPLSDAAWMFDWAGPTVPPGQNYVKASDSNPGTRVWVH